jgi:hypothetical protein
MFTKRLDLDDLLRAREIMISTAAVSSTPMQTVERKRVAAGNVAQQADHAGPNA